MPSDMERAAMCGRLWQLQDSMGPFAAAFDAALFSVEDGWVVVAEATAIERMDATVKGRAAGGATWKAAGEQSPAHHLARATGTSVSTASEVLETAQRLEAMSALAAAARAGELSPAQTAAVADAAVVDPSTEQRLIEVARRSSLAELRQECVRTKAAARPDAEARQQAIHDSRYLGSWTDAEGAWNLRTRETPKSAPRSWPPSMPSVTGCSPTCWTGCAPTTTTSSAWNGVGPRVGRGKRVFVPVDDHRHPRHSVEAASWRAF
jgi:hypothetical protein